MEQKESVQETKNPFEMLEELLWQDQFELILPDIGNTIAEEKAAVSDITDNLDEKAASDLTYTSGAYTESQRAHGKQDIRLVYLMNDAVESFLVFTNARMTGQYQPGYEGELEAELRREDMETGSTYVLVVHQGDSVVTLFFEDLKSEIHLYRYGDLGHFWVKGYEYLRQLEYRLAILHTKCEYLGEDAASAEERRLAELVHFPPLNYACYPAVPEKYIVPMDDVWKPAEAAIQIMEELAEEAGDRTFLRWLSYYRKHHGKGMSRLLAWMLHRQKHARIADLLENKLIRESERYPVRSDCFDEVTQHYYREILTKAEKRKEELEAAGMQVTLVREEPFTTAGDSVEYHVYLMIWKVKRGDRIVEVEMFS